jgi:mannose-6-phosphate isomerase
MPWGGRRLQDVLHKELPSAQSCGESWEVSDHPLHSSIVAEGPCVGRTLRSLLESDREALLGNRARAGHGLFPWLVKYLDAHDWLSVQVHPDDEQAGRLWPGEGGKTEAWFVLDAAPGGRIFAGLQPGVDEAVLRSALTAGNVTECLHSFTPRRGDCVFLPAGTVHAVGAGVLLAELQQSSDATFRLFDWDRRDRQGKSRPLHIEESLACINWQQGAISPLHVAEFENVTAEWAQAPTVVRPLIDCRFFELAYRQDTQPFVLGGDGRMRVCQVIAGSGRLGDCALLLGQTWLLPAALDALACTPDSRLALLIGTLP